MIIDDYGHHPEEIRATLRAARELWKFRKIWVLFQPHRFTRTRLLLREFTEAFGDADQLLVDEIYPAGEEPIRGISGASLAAAIGRRPSRTRGSWTNVRFCGDRREMLEIVQRGAKRGDVVLTLGAGDIWKVGRELAKIYESRD